MLRSFLGGLPFVYFQATALLDVPSFVYLKFISWHISKIACRILWACSDCEVAVLCLLQWLICLVLQSVVKIISCYKLICRPLLRLVSIPGLALHVKPNFEFFYFHLASKMFSKLSCNVNQRIADILLDLRLFFSSVASLFVFISFNSS